MKRTAVEALPGPILCGNGPVFAVAQALDLGRNLERRVLSRKFLRWKFGRRRIRISRIGMGAGLRAKSGEAFDERDRLIEHLAKMARGPVCEGFEGGQAAQSATSLSRLVTGRSVMPQGLMSAKSPRSVVTLNANPCEVTPRAT